MMNKYFTANYINTDSNFGIFNLNDQRIEGKECSAICVLLNILQRGCPTKPSKYLTDKIEVNYFDQSLHFLSSDVPNWGEIIKGGEDDNNNPANTFFYEMIPDYFPDYPYLSQLFRPEVLITDIVKTDSDSFVDQRVDFYLPQAKLVIEIDGTQHEEMSQKMLDKSRDAFFEHAEIKTIRITSKSIKNRDAELKKKMNQIRKRIDDNRAVFEEYDRSFNLCKDIHTIEDKIGLACAIRLQITILELLLSGAITLKDDSWKFRIRSREVSGYEKIAIIDLLKWLDTIYTLAGIEHKIPRVQLWKKNIPDNTSKEFINIDLSVLTIATPENTKERDTIFVYSASDQETDYFVLNTAEPIIYELEDFKEGSADELNPKRKALKQIMTNIFGHDSFRKGQERIVINLLKRRNTIGILPTGSGKSLCYQLSALLQPGISMCVCPIKSLMIDQNDELYDMGVTRTAFISSDLSATERKAVQDAFSRGNYLITFMSPERFQDETFRDFLLSMTGTDVGRFAYAVVDEVHCLSEWGHNFRVSYLNLIKTIKRYCSEATIIGLTATASLRVIKNILLEFGMDNRDDIISASSFDRPELDFKVEQVLGGNKQDVLFERIDRYRNHYHDLLEPVGKDGKASRCGIVFTPHVNGKYGCVEVASSIADKYNADVKYYSGQKPKYYRGSSTQWDEEKRAIQKEFKNNQFTLLAATKAFGMGINKPNIRYTIHYGLPESLEALYQEAGRAGRDGKKAQCLVIYNKETEENESKLKSVLEKTDASVEAVKEAVKVIGFNGEDLTRQTFLFSNGLVSLQDELDCAGRIIEALNKGEKVLVAGDRKELDLMQKVTYHLAEIGIVYDWTVDWKLPALKIYVNNYSEETIKKKIIDYISTYESEDTQEIAETIKTIQGVNYELKLLAVFWKWYNESIVYSRKQALLQLDEACYDYARTNDAEKFRARMEAYFKLDDVVDSIGEIADNPRDYKAWFNIINKHCIDKNTASGIIMRLNRFLESYRQNTGLNYVSGILNLIDHSFESLNGKPRLEQALKIINGLETSDRETILINTAQVIAMIEDADVKELFASYYIENYEIEEIEVILYKILNDNYSLSIVLKKAMKKLYKMIGE